MQEIKKAVIGSKSYELYQLTPKIALKNYFKLQKLLLSPLGAALGSIDFNKGADNVGDLDVDLEKVLKSLSTSIMPEELTDLMVEMIEGSVKNDKGMAIAFDVEFLGDISQALAVFKEVVTHNYPNFFGMLLGLVGLSPENMATILAKLGTSPSFGVPSSKA